MGWGGGGGREGAGEGGGGGGLVRTEYVNAAIILCIMFVMTKKESQDKTVYTKGQKREGNWKGMKYTAATSQSWH